MSNIIKHYVECQCDSGDHVIRFIYLPNEKLKYEPDLYMEVQMSQPHNFLGWIWNAFKYIFNKDCEYGHWDCTLIGVEQADKLIKLLEKFKKEHKEYEESKKA